MDSVNKPLVALAGASGFVGTHLRLRLAEGYRFRALTRSPNIMELHGAESATQWQYCDLYSLPQVSEALQGCEIGIYLVHSMAPSSRLTQADFEDTDLLLADNFIRAAEAAGSVRDRPPARGIRRRRPRVQVHAGRERPSQLLLLP